MQWSNSPLFESFLESSAAPSNAKDGNCNNTGNTTSLVSKMVTTKIAKKASQASVLSCRILVLEHLYLVG